MTYERSALATRFVPKPKCACVAAVDEHHAFQAARAVGRKEGGQLWLGRQRLLATRDLHRSACHDSAQALSRRLADLTGLFERDAAVASGLENCLGQRMFGISLQAGRKSQDFSRVESRGRKLLGEARFAIGQSSGLVEDHGAAL